MVPCASDLVLVKYKLFMESRQSDPYIARALEMFNWYLGVEEDGERD